MCQTESQPGESRHWQNQGASERVASSLSLSDLHCNMGMMGSPPRVGVQREHPASGWSNRGTGRPCCPVPAPPGRPRREAERRQGRACRRPAAAGEHQGHGARQHHLPGVWGLRGRGRQMWPQNLPPPFLAGPQGRSGQEAAERCVCGRLAGGQGSRSQIE